jgi:hypothetical protein
MQNNHALEFLRIFAASKGIIDLETGLFKMV